MTDLARLLEIAEGAVAVAADLVESREPGALHSKGDRDMASDTDIAVEQAVREHLAKVTPEIAFLGEEEGAHPGEGELSWVLDPIDGTVNYIHGVPLWGISLGLVDGNKQVAGVLDFPMLGTRLPGRGRARCHAERRSDPGQQDDRALRGVGHGRRLRGRRRRG